MEGKMSELTEKRTIKILIFITWITYFSTYLGRLNFSASINEISMELQISKGSIGAIASAFFVAYETGQIISGWLGDHLPAKFMVFCGVAGAALMNLAFAYQAAPSGMKIIWFMNGIFQSMVWAPMAKWISDRVDRECCAKICLLLSTTSPVGMLCAYLMSAVCIRYYDWRKIFLSAAGMMGGIAVLWLVFSFRLEKMGRPVAEKRESREKEKDNGLWIAAVQSGLVIIAVSACFHGILKDGISTWVPVYLAENCSVSSVGAIILTMVLPVINLLGVYWADWWNQNCFHTEMKTVSAFFCITAAAVVGMSLFGKQSAVISIVFFAVITTSMTGINTLLVSLIPLYFKKAGCISTVIGVLNAATYGGTALGSWLFGVIAEKCGWGILRGIWFALGTAGAGISWMIWKKWHRFRRKS